MAAEKKKKSTKSSIKAKEKKSSTKPVKKSSPATSKKQEVKKKAPETPKSSAHLHSADPIGLTDADLNPKEKKVLTFLRQSKKPKTLDELAEHLFPGTRPQARANSQVRNSIRRLVREKFIRKFADGRKGDGPSQYIAKSAKK